MEKIKLTKGAQTIAFPENQIEYLIKSGWKKEVTPVVVETKTETKGASKK